MSRNAGLRRTLGVGLLFDETCRVIKDAAGAHAAGRERPGPASLARHVFLLPHMIRQF
jgi:hypothetical protein